MTKDEALTLALEALEMYCEHGAILRPIETRDAIKEALAQPDEQDRCTHGVWAADHCYKCAASQPEQEPVAWWDAKLGVFDEKHFDQLQPLYTSPPQRQPLTNEQLDALALDDGGLPNSHFEFARAIEAAHGIGDKT